MKAGQLERMQEQLQRLRLFKSRERIEALLQEAVGKGLSLGTQKCTKDGSEKCTTSTGVRR